MGRRATRKLLEVYSARNKTLEGAITTYAPPPANKTEDYIQDVAKRTGIPRTALLKNLTAAQMEAIAQAMFHHEGWETGTIHQLPPSKNPQTGKYIWHTAEDEKVRPSHAERDGKVFDFAHPPIGGNPGDDYNCRCTAETISDGTANRLTPDKSLKQVFGK
jgi:SPP1 gp7 family putative phage head morphogenesis protein